MFDIISFIREKIFRRPKLKTLNSGEELSEKQTTKLGYFLLFLMFLAIITSAQWTIGIIHNLVDRPDRTPYCLDNIIDRFESEDYRDYYSYNCNLSSLVSNNPEFNFKSDYNELKPAYDNINTYIKEILNLEDKLGDIDYKYVSSQRDYELSLLEKIANQDNSIYDDDYISNILTDSEQKALDISYQIKQTKLKVDNIRSKYKLSIDTLKAKLEKTDDEYNIAYLKYKAIIALLSFIFIISVFYVLYKIYLKQKIKNSPYTIIFSVATFAYGLVFIQIAFYFIWDLIPHRFLEWLASLFSLFKPLSYIIQFLWPILIVGIFGFLVYKIQKRLYSPENVLKRFIKDKKCPNCGNDVDYKKVFCPLCSYEIQNKCKNCGNFNVKGMPYCSSCGKKQ